MEEPKTKSNEFVFSSSLPYPPVVTDGTNPEYAAAMLDNMAGQLSEATAIHSYNYNNLIIHDEEAAYVFQKISIVEMQHLHTFGQLAIQLGENPRLWSQGRGTKLYWSPSFITYPNSMDELFQNAIREEKKAIEKYAHQAEQIQDPNIQTILKRIILDEEVHIDVFNTIYENFCKKRDH